MGHHALAGRKHLSIPLSNGGGAMALWVMWVEERGMWVAWEEKVSQGIHGKHNSMQERSCLRVTPHPPFTAFLGLWGSNGGSWMGVLGWCRPCRAKWGIFWVNIFPPNVWGQELIVWLTDIIGFIAKRWCFLGWGMVAFGFCINMVPINGWDTNNVWHVYGWGRHPHAHDNVKRIIWCKL